MNRMNSEFPNTSRFVDISYYMFYIRMRHLFACNVSLKQIISSLIFFSFLAGIEILRLWFAACLFVFNSIFISLAFENTIIFEYFGTQINGAHGVVIFYLNFGPSNWKKDVHFMARKVTIRITWSTHTYMYIYIVYTYKRQNDWKLNSIKSKLETVQTQFSHYDIVLCSSSVAATYYQQLVSCV